MIKHIVDDVEQSNLQRLGMLQQIVSIDKLNLHFAYQVDGDLFHLLENENETNCQ
jgi:hypothetical protein